MRRWRCATNRLVHSKWSEQPCCFNAMPSPRSTMRGICGIGQSPFCREPTSFGTNILTWRRCWNTWLAVVPYLSDGWSGSRRNRPGSLMSNLSSGTQRLLKKLRIDATPRFCSQVQRNWSSKGNLRALCHDPPRREKLDPVCQIWRRSWLHQKRKVKVLKASWIIASML